MPAKGETLKVLFVIIVDYIDYHRYALIMIMIMFVDHRRLRSITFTPTRDSEEMELNLGEERALNRKQEKR